MLITVGKSRKSTDWKVEDISWEKLVNRLERNIRTEETAAEYAAMTPAQRDEIKDIGGFVGGELEGGRRTKSAVKNRTLITLDLDDVEVWPWPLPEPLDKYAAALYSTHSYTPDHPHLRILIPLARAVTPAEYEIIARKAGDIIGGCDPSTYDINRLMYWPSTPSDVTPVFEAITDAPFLNPDDFLADAIVEQELKKATDPRTKEGDIGAFCRAYTVEDVIDKFLPDVYLAGSAAGRYTYANGSTANGAVVYQDGLFLYSFHSTDPANTGHVLNAFDLLRIHKFGGDMQKTLEFISNDPLVRKERIHELTEALEIDNIDWIVNLEIKKDKPATTISNIVLILTNDERLKDAYYYDEFYERQMVIGDLPWRTFDGIPRQWDDTDDAGLHDFLEHEYKIDNLNKTREAVNLAFLKRRRHPVREYLNALEWDGKARLDTVLINTFGADNTAYTRAVTRKAFIGAVARIMRPGCKHDHVLVLVGKQGIGKSTFLHTIGKEWFSDSLFTFNGKDAFEQLQGAWIIELSEMASISKTEIELVKQFLSKQEDIYRAAYDRRTQVHPRQCAFFGTTNDDEFLRDWTGSRRFWPVPLKHFGVLNEADVDQLWAEAVAAYKAGENWYLDKALEKEAEKVQKDFTEQNGWYGIIEEFISRPVPPDFDNWSQQDRVNYWMREDYSDGIPRTKVCALEIYIEALGGDKRTYSPQIARRINAELHKMEGWQYTATIYCGVAYGRQRGFIPK